MRSSWVCVLGVAPSSPPRASSGRASGAGRMRSPRCTNSTRRRAGGGSPPAQTPRRDAAGEHIELPLANIREALGAADWFWETIL